MEEQTLRERADRRELQQIISGLTEGVVLVDPDGAIVWANETALRIHGAQRLDDLGHSAAAYRTKFKLRYRNNRRIQPRNYPIQRALNGETFGGVVVEVSPARDRDRHWIHRVRSLALVNGAGAPDGFALVIHDLTDQVSAEERFEQTFAANPAPAVICRLPDLRFIKANDGFLEMTGYAREALLRRSARQMDLLDGVTNRELALERLAEGRTIPQMEAQLPLPGGAIKFVIVAGQPIEFGEEKCMLFTFADLDPRRKAEDALRQSEERFAKAFRLAPVPMALSTRDGLNVLDVNDAFVAVTGYGADEVVGRSLVHAQLFANPARYKLEREIARSTNLKNREIQLHTKSGDAIDCLISADTVTISQQPCVLTVFQDITERKRSEEELLQAIDAVMQDTSWFSRTLLEKLANIRTPRANGADSGALADLTAREREVLSLICQGLADSQIANRLQVSRNTVRNHLAAIYLKIDVHTRSAAVIWARERGFTGKDSFTSGKNSLVHPHRKG